MANIDASNVRNGVRIGSNARGYNEGWVGRGGDYFSYDINSSRLKLSGYTYINGIYRTYDEYYYGNLSALDLDNANSLSSVRITSYSAIVNEGTRLHISDVSVDGWTVYYAILGWLSVSELETSFLSGSDEFSGSSARDHVYLKDGNDVIKGYGGNDSLYGEGGSDLIKGGTGNDYIYGGSGIDQLTGGPGNDRIYGGSGSADTAIYSGSLLDYSIEKGTTTYTITDLRSGSPDGTDKFDKYIEILRFTDQSLTPDQAIDAISADRNKTLIGTSGDDQLSGNEGDDYGNDTIGGAGGSDTIYGYGGTDSLIGGAGLDSIYGGDGNDRIEGGTGDDYLNGGKWGYADDIYGGEGDDFLGGGGGPDSLYGEAGIDEIRAGHGKDYLDGGAGGDTLYGGGGGNTFASEQDGAVDNLYVMSDFRGHGYSWGRNHAGINADVITELDLDDRITILGTTDANLTFANVAAGTHNQSQAGIGIFDGGTLEAIYLGSNLSITQLDAITGTDASRFW